MVSKTVLVAALVAAVSGQSDSCSGDVDVPDTANDCVAPCCARVDGGIEFSHASAGNIRIHSQSPEPMTVSFPQLSRAQNIDMRSTNVTRVSFPVLEELVNDGDSQWPMQNQASLVCWGADVQEVQAPILRRLWSKMGEAQFHFYGCKIIQSLSFPKLETIWSGEGDSAWMWIDGSAWGDDTPAVLEDVFLPSLRSVTAPWGEAAVVLFHLANLQNVGMPQLSELRGKLWDESSPDDGDDSYITIGENFDTVLQAASFPSLQNVYQIEVYANIDAPVKLSFPVLQRVDVVRISTGRGLNPDCKSRTELHICDAEMKVQSWTTLDVQCTNLFANHESTASLCDAMDDDHCTTSSDLECLAQVV